MSDTEIKMRKAFELSDLLYSRERDKVSSGLEKKLSKISEEFNLKGTLYSGMHVNKILDKRMEIINQLVDFKISQDIKEISKRFGVLTKEIYDELFKRAKQLINGQIDNLKLEMEKFCRHSHNPDSYLSLINNRIIEEKNKLSSHAKREVDIFHIQSESKTQEKKVFSEISIPKKEIKLSVSDAWNKIKNDYDISKYAFSRKIYFVKDPFKKKIIFRDIGQAYLLAEKDFSKPAVILAGGVIEELLRYYLKFKNIKPLKNNFDEYIRTCEDNRLFKKGISQLSHSLRNFRNIVHLENEVSGKYTISKATAKGAISSIFTISNDF